MTTISAIGEDITICVNNAVKKSLIASKAIHATVESFDSFPFKFYIFDYQVDSQVTMEDMKNIERIIKYNMRNKGVKVDGVGFSISIVIESPQHYILNLRVSLRVRL